MADTPPDNRGDVTVPLDAVNQARLANTVLPGADEMYCAQCNTSYTAPTAVCPNDGSRLVRIEAERDTLLGKVLDGRYEIKAALGKGGMGSVYTGIQLSVDREVAIKVIHPKLARDKDAVKRFLREAKLASKLSQPSIVNVHDFGTSDGVLYLVMELLRGHTLSSELGKGRRISVRRTLVIGMQLCDALEAAHAQDIIHRDLKPGNIIILDDPSGRDLIKVLDFGLAKSVVTGGESRITDTDAILGTPLYMSPEQIHANPSDQRTDLYSLGCILYEMLTGSPPFTGPTPQAILAHHLTSEAAPLPSHVPQRVSALILRLLAKDPVDRIQSAGDVRGVLELALESAAVRTVTPVAGVPALDTPDTVPEEVPPAFADTAMAQAKAPVEPPAKPSRMPLIVGGVAAIGIATVVVVMLGSRGGSDPGAGSAKQLTPDAAAIAAPDGAPVIDAAIGAAEAAVMIDAAIVPADARPVATDARRKLPADAAVPQVVPDAAVKAPVDAATPPIDAKPTIDFYPTKK